MFKNQCVVEGLTNPYKQVFITRIFHRCAVFWLLPGRLGREKFFLEIQCSCYGFLSHLKNEFCNTLGIVLSCSKQNKKHTMSLSQLSPELVEKARVELNEEPDTRMNFIQELREKSKTRTDLRIEQADKVCKCCSFSITRNSITHVFKLKPL